jgi:predicted nucleic acid-binding protein
VFRTPTPLVDAIEFVEILRSMPQAVIVQPGRRHWDIFTKLCLEARATGNLIPDAYIGAIAIESGCEFVTTDRDFARFHGLTWRDPLSA